MEQPGDDKYKLEIGRTEGDDEAKSDYLNVLLLRNGMLHFVKEDTNGPEHSTDRSSS